MTSISIPFKLSNNFNVLSLGKMNELDRLARCSRYARRKWSQGLDACHISRYKWHPARTCVHSDDALIIGPAILGNESVHRFDSWHNPPFTKLLSASAQQAISSPSYTDTSF